MSAEKVKLIAETGEQLEFDVIAGVNVDGAYYTIMKPVVLPKGMAQNEALVFEVVRQRGSVDERFRPVADREIIESVFAEYNKMLH